MLTHIALLALTLSGPTAHTATRPYGYYRPRVEVWTAKGDNPFFRGDGARVYLRADQDAYVTLFRVDTDGRVRVLFPRAPWEDNFVRGGQEFEVQNYASSYAFTVDDYPGVGYMLLNAVTYEDYPLMQALFLLITVTVLLAILLADIATAIFDPRTRTAG